MMLSQKFARTFCLVLAAFFLLWLLVQGGFALRGIFSRYRFFSVISGSMEPALPVGCIIVIDTEKNRLYTPGEIITYRQGDEYITHRVAELGYNGSFFYRTRGDANKFTDSDPVAHRAVVGRVVLAVPLSPAFMLRHLRTAFPVLLAVPAAVFFTRRLHRRKKAVRLAAMRRAAGFSRRK